MVLSATERTTQVRAPGKARMRQEVNPTVCAAHEATPQLGMGLQDRVQSGLIVTDQRVGAIVPVPVVAKRENFPDCDDKKPRLSLTMRSVLVTPSSYRLDAKASRGRARFFCGLPTQTLAVLRHHRYNTPCFIASYRLRHPPSLPSANPEDGYLKEGTSPSFSK